MTNNTGTAPLSVEVTRQEMHSRLIDMRGWGQSDGPYEVEGRVVDRKPHEFKSPNGFKVVPAGEPIHDMGVKLVFDSEMLVREVSTFTAAAPYGDCLSAGQTIQTLKGLRIGAGWGAEVRKRLGREQSCTHLMELLFPMATVALQTLIRFRADVVRRNWPAFYTGPKDKSDPT